MVRVQAWAKINLGLKVLHKRPDDYHELRTIFQTVSLADELTFDWQPRRPTRITLDDGGLGLAENLVTKAATLLLDAARAKGRLHITLRKRIPTGAGLGGGSADAAAVLNWGRSLEKDVDYAGLALSLGADVPFFLHGGTALAFGRGEEIYELPDPPSPHAVIAMPRDVHVSTPAAFKALNRGPLNSPLPSAKLERFQALARSVAACRPASEWKSLCENDFEAAVFLQVPVLQEIKDMLDRLGADGARMTGSGAAMFGFFPSREKAVRAAKRLEGLAQAWPVAFVSRRRYAASWRRWTKDAIRQSQDHLGQR